MERQVDEVCGRRGCRERVRREERDGVLVLGEGAIAL